jgi:hypothetical protein
MRFGVSILLATGVLSPGRGAAPARPKNETFFPAAGTAGLAEPDWLSGTAWPQRGAIFRLMRVAFAEDREHLDVSFPRTEGRQRVVSRLPNVG